MEQDGCLINLEDLGSTCHPCLAEGEFLVFDHPRVAPLILMRDFEYTINLDGFLILSN